jgi:hypothetical protein
MLSVPLVASFHTHVPTYLPKLGLGWLVSHRTFLGLTGPSSLPARPDSVSTSANWARVRGLHKYSEKECLGLAASLVRLRVLNGRRSRLSSYAFMRQARGSAAISFMFASNRR